MYISTRGRYALRVMLDLAENATCEYTPMKEVAKRQEISLKYIERIMPALVQAGFVEGVHGRGGGYRLVHAPKIYTVGAILRLSEGELAPVACLSCDADPCSRAANCKTLPLWKKLDTMVNDFFDSITLQDLLDSSVK